LRIDTAALKARLGMLALLWAALPMAALGAGTAAPVPTNAAPSPSAAKVPSIEISQTQTTLAGTCSGGAFDINTFINVGPQASADVRLSAPGAGILEEFTDETGKNVGTYNAKYPAFHIPAFGGGLAPNTLITLAITTYSGPGLTGAASFTSTIIFNCTTGVITFPSALALQPIPTLDDSVLFATITLVALFGAAMLINRRAPLRRKR
jgi:hypothetical protein